VTTQPWTSPQRPHHRWWNGNVPPLPPLPPIHVPGT
jgi:hypothetical protein